MNVKIKIYQLLVDKVPGIQSRYQSYRKKCEGWGRIRAWLYLLKINFQYYILREKNAFNQVSLQSDDEIRIPSVSESSLSLLEDPEKFAEKLEGIDVISFDVFDTLILRGLDCPEDVFFLVQNQLHYPDLKRIRIKAEKRARQEREIRYSDREVTLDEIWEVVFQATGIDREKGAEAEWSSEKSICFANPYFLTLVKILKKQKKKVIVCSDMYLGSKKIRELLQMKGYPAFDGYYVSSDFRCSKSTGELYDVIRRDYGEDIKYIQIGDNDRVDGAEARKKGFETFRYCNVHDAGEPYRAKDLSPLVSSVYSGIVNGYIHNGLYELSRMFEFGFIYGGLFVTGYCQFIHDYVKKNQIERILFVARDGDILYQAYQLLYPNDSERCRYVYWSRLCSLKLCARSYKAYYLERMLFYKVNQGYKLSDVFHTMEIDDMFKTFLATSHGRYTEATVLNNESSHSVAEYLDRHWDEVCQHYDEEVKEGERYFREMIGNGKRVVVVDVGWVGSSTLTLRHMIEEVWNMDCKVSGLMAGTCGGNDENYEVSSLDLSLGNLSSYLFSAEENRDIWARHDAAKGHNLVLELLLSSNQPTFRGFKKNRDGTYSFSDKQEKIDAEEIQRGILKFVHMFVEHPLNQLKIAGRDAAAPIKLLYQNESYMRDLIEKSEIEWNIT